MARGGDGSNQHSKTANLQNSISQADAAKLLNVSERNLQEAKRAQEHAPAEVVEAMDAGRISPGLASKVADLPDAAKADVTKSLTLGPEA